MQFIDSANPADFNRQFSVTCPEGNGLPCRFYGVSVQASGDGLVYLTDQFGNSVVSALTFGGVRFDGMQFEVLPGTTKEFFISTTTPSQRLFVSDITFMVTHEGKQKVILPRVAQVLGCDKIIYMPSPACKG
jgi:hypothetical protein